MLLLSIGLPLLLGALFLPAEIVSMREEPARCNRTGPFAYLDQRPGGGYERLAMTEIDALQGPQGLVSRRVGSRYGDHYVDGADTTRARLSPDGGAVLTGTATIPGRGGAARRMGSRSPGACDRGIALVACMALWLARARPAAG